MQEKIDQLTASGLEKLKETKQTQHGVDGCDRLMA